MDGTPASHIPAYRPDPPVYTIGPAITRHDSVPGRINVLEVDSVEGKDATPDRLGGCAYAPEFTRYIKDSLPRWVAEQRGDAAWWDVSYVKGRLYARFGKQVTDAAVMIWRDERTVAQAAEAVSMKPIKLSSELNLLVRLVPFYWRQTHYAVVAKARRTQMRESCG
jgi:hypothetical protein